MPKQPAKKKSAPAKSVPVSKKPAKNSAAPAKSKSAKSTAVKSAPVKAPPVKTAPVKTAAVKTIAVKTAPVKTETVKTSSSKVIAIKKSSKPTVVMKPQSSYRPLRSSAPLEQAAQMAVVVPTNGKPKKNVVGFNTKDLEHFRDLLLDKRRELLGDVRSMESEALRSSGANNLSSLPIHMADMGTDNYEQEFTLGLVEKDRLLLREINQALAKIQNGTYGLCEGTGKPISKPRLEAQPWAKYSIEFAREREKRMGR